MRKLYFIVNPIAGAREKASLLRAIEKGLDSSIFKYTVQQTQYPHHATLLTQEALSQEYDAIIAVGGDGTVHEVGNQLIGKDIALGIIPAGSANGLARHLKIPLDFEKAIKVISEFHLAKIDTVSVNHDRAFLGTAGMGYDAYLALKVQKTNQRGLLNYLKLIFSELWSYKEKCYHLIIDGKVYKQRAFIVAFANIAQYGGNAYIAPKAHVNDGYLDIVIAKPFPRYMTPILTYQLFAGSLHLSSYVEIIKCRHVQIQQEHTEGHLDGEPFETDEVLDLKINPRSLNVLVAKTTSLTDL